MTAFRFDGLRRTVEQAIADGHAARRATAQKERESELAWLKRESELFDARIEHVMTTLPQRITKAVIGAQAWPVQCPVMLVEPSEYEGPVHYRLWDDPLKPPVYTHNLRGAAARIFEELLAAGYEPTLTYANLIDFDNWFGKHKDYHDLCISISVQ